MSITLIVVNFNNAQYIQDQLNGIKNQTKLADDVIILDNGSTDNSVALIKQFIQEYPGSVHGILLEENQGFNNAANIALTDVYTDYVFFGAADDYILPTFVEKNLAVLSESKLSCSLPCFTDDRKDFAANGGSTEYDLLSAGTVKRLFLKGEMWIAGHTTVFPVKELREIGGHDDDLSWKADWFNCHTLAALYGIYYINESLSVKHHCDSNSWAIHNLHKKPQIIDNIKARLEEDYFQDAKQAILHILSTQ